MTNRASALMGWATSSVATTFAVIAWRSRAARMEAVIRACHELRGPLTAARLGLELARRVGELSPARLRAIDLELTCAAVALDELAGEPGAPGLNRASEAVDAAELLVDSVEAMGVSAVARDVALELQWSGGSPMVWGDRVRLAQAIRNLIANAIEHGGEAVEVRGRGAERSVRVEVIDNGPGLPAPVAELVRHARAGRGRRGRGLAIATAIVEAHGGRLAAAPSERGARLVLQLPAAATARSARWPN